MNFKKKPKIGGSDDEGDEDLKVNKPVMRNSLQTLSKSESSVFQASQIPPFHNPFLKNFQSKISNSEGQTPSSNPFQKKAIPDSTNPPEPRYSTQTSVIQQKIVNLNKIKLNGGEYNYYFELTLLQEKQLKNDGYFLIDQIFDTNRQLVNYQAFGVKDLMKEKEKLFEVLSTKEFPLTFHPNQYSCEYDTHTSIRYYLLFTVKKPKSVSVIPTDFFSKPENIVNTLLYLRNKLKYMKTFYQTFKVSDLYFTTNESQEKMNNNQFTVNMAEFIVLSLVKRINDSSKTFNNMYKMIGSFAKSLLPNNADLNDFQIVIDIIEVSNRKDFDSSGEKLIDSLLRTYYSENPINQQKGIEIINFLQAQLKMLVPQEEEEKTEKIPNSMRKSVFQKKI